MINWVSKIWREFNPDVISNSFDLTRITSSDSQSFHSNLRNLLALSDELTHIPTAADSHASDELTGAFEADKRFELDELIDIDDNDEDEDESDIDHN